MSQMPPFLRGYRRALRDVQRAVVLHAQTVLSGCSSRSALSAVADGLSVPLRQIRGIGIAALDEDVREQMVAVSTTQSDYVRGYQSGFDQATKMVAGWGCKMIDPAARNAIAGAVTHLRESQPHEST
jgi:hypothetical protein